MSETTEPETTPTSTPPTEQTKIKPTVELMFDTSRKVIAYRKGIDDLRGELQDRQAVLANTWAAVQQLESYLAYLEENQDKEEVDTIKAFLETQANKANSTNKTKE